MNSFATNGIVTNEKDGYKVRFERTLNYPAEKVWHAITNTKQMALWFTDVEMDFREGGSMTIWFRDEARTKSTGKILRIKKPTLFEWMWEEELATWEITPVTSNSCVLVLTYSKLPSSYAVSVPAGWHVLLNQLETILKGRKEPYPFGGEETPETKTMRALYTEIIHQQFPELKNNAE